jgi:hypothetical protein
MHTAHHWLLGVSRPRAIAASTLADKGASENSDAERVAPIGVQLLTFLLLESPPATTPCFGRIAVWQ